MEFARVLVAFVAMFCFGGLVADALVPWSARQHLWNPRWPPHAKFHNAQTMVLGMLNGGIALGLLFGVRPLTWPVFLAAAVLSSLYWIALLAAAWFPGTAWTDPEFAAETPRPLGMHPQMLVSLVLLGVLAVAVAWAGVSVWWNLD